MINSDVRNERTRETAANQCCWWDYLSYSLMVSRKKYRQWLAGEHTNNNNIGILQNLHEHSATCTRNPPTPHTNLQQSIVSHPPPLLTCWGEGRFWGLETCEERWMTHYRWLHIYKSADAETYCSELSRHLHLHRDRHEIKSDTQSHRGMTLEGSKERRSDTVYSTTSSASSPS